jgi:LacI family transcriptional regulator, repressor for deo operon, udp, cdd, tsx, nupC, and nupG
MTKARNNVTIVDVAREAGVSPGTVSRVLNGGKAKISDATTQLVKETAKRLGYRPNISASSLRTQRTGVIGAIVRDMTDPFLSLLTRELQASAHGEGIEMLIGHARADLETAERQINIMRNWFDGVFLIGDIPGDQQVAAQLIEYRTPFVAVARGSQSAIQSAMPSVGIDEEAGVRMAMDYLAKLGHRRIGFIGQLEHEGINERYRAFMQYVQVCGLEWYPDYLQPCPNVRGEAVLRAQNLLSHTPPPTAIFCATDLQAISAISGAWQMGWRVPESISVIGFDDIEEAAGTFPALTTIRQPVGHIAAAAMTLLKTLIGQENNPDEELAGELPESALHVRVQPRLVVRRSCAPPIA